MSLLSRFERWDPFEEMTQLRTRMDRLWNRMTDDETALTEWTPASDVVEMKDAIVIKAELPGIEPKDVQVEMENGILTIKGERKAEKETEEQGHRRIERSYGAFLRTFTLPPNVDQERIAAAFDNGLLEVRLPKKEGAKPKTIRVDVKKQLATAA